MQRFAIPAAGWRDRHLSLAFTEAPCSAGRGDMLYGDQLLARSCLSSRGQTLQAELRLRKPGWRRIGPPASARLGRGTGGITSPASRSGPAVSLCTQQLQQAALLLVRRRRSHFVDSEDQPLAPGRARASNPSSFRGPADPVHHPGISSRPGGPLARIGFAVGGPFCACFEKARRVPPSWQPAASDPLQPQLVAVAIGR